MTTKSKRINYKKTYINIILCTYNWRINIIREHKNIISEYIITKFKQYKDNYYKRKRNE